MTHPADAAPACESLGPVGTWTVTRCAGDPLDLLNMPVAGTPVLGWADATGGDRSPFQAPRDDDDLADIEFDTDEEAREAGFVPGWRVGRYLCTDPQQYGHANVHGTPGQTPTQDQQAADDQRGLRVRPGTVDRRSRRVVSALAFSPQLASQLRWQVRQEAAR